MKYRHLLYLVCLSLCLIFLPSCATSEKYQAMLMGWAGIEEHVLVEAWGPPDSVYEVSENERMLTYVKSGTKTISGTPSSSRIEEVNGVLRTVSYGGSESTTYNLYCKTSFTVRDRIIIGWRSEGNNCVSE